MKHKKQITFKEFRGIFHSLTGLNISFVDANADFIIKAEKSERFCEMQGDIERNTGVSKCWISNYKACRKALAAKRPIVYTCHAGLTEIVVPVFVDNSPIGAIITGQVRMKGIAKFKNAHKSTISPVIKERMKCQFIKVREVARAELHAAAKLLYLMADKVIKNNLVMLYHEKNDLETSNMRSVLVSITSYVRENFRNPDISLSEVAKQVNLSAYYISHIFTREFNVSFVDFLTKVRLDEAKAQLSTIPDKSVKEIAYDIGYSDPYYFGKVFKKYVKMTPLDYRKRSQK